MHDERATSPTWTLRLPPWVEAEQRLVAGRRIAGDDERMAWVVELARQNVERGTGGPFAAAVFDEAGRVVAPGVNLVEASGTSIAHAELVAVVLAQQQVGTFSLAAAAGQDGYQLFTSAEPCAMCLGAVPWSGVTRLVCAARDEDVRAIGFDEGAKPADWPAELAARGIDVRRDVGRATARLVLARYAELGRLIYDGRDPRAAAGPAGSGQS